MHAGERRRFNPQQGVGVVDVRAPDALSRPRRLLTDLSHLSRGFPRETLLTRINVAALVEPRSQARIPWPVVFAKAFAMVAAGAPPLRRVYVKLPWPHLYELAPERCQHYRRA
jgi:hypothetical protein